MSIVKLYRQSDIDALTQQIDILELQIDEYLDLLAECRDACGPWFETSSRIEAIGCPSYVPDVVKEKIEMLLKGDYR